MFYCKRTQTAKMHARQNTKNQLNTRHADAGLLQYKDSKTNTLVLLSLFAKWSTICELWRWHQITI